MAFPATSRACAVTLPVLFYRDGHLRGNDACGNGNDAITQQHNKTGDELTQRRSRRHIAITNRSNGNNSPVHRLRNACEPGVIIFYQINNRTKDHHAGDHEEYEDADLAQTIDDGHR